VSAGAKCVERERPGETCFTSVSGRLLTIRLHLFLAANNIYYRAVQKREEQDRERAQRLQQKARK
jgi:hypothetical protein